MDAVAQAQVLLSGGLTYSQNFDSLASSMTGTTVPWTDNSTLVGWYASRAITASGGAYGPTAYTSYRVAPGTNNSGWVYSFGAARSREAASCRSPVRRCSASGWLMLKVPASEAIVIPRAAASRRIRSATSARRWRSWGTWARPAA